MTKNQVQEFELLLENVTRQLFAQKFHESISDYDNDVWSDVAFRFVKAAKGKKLHFLKNVKTIDQFLSDGEKVIKAKKWIYATKKRVEIDLHRRAPKTRTGRSFFQLIESATNRNDRNLDPKTKEFIHDLYALADRHLDEEERLLFSLYLRGDTQAQIGHELAVTPRTVYTRLKKLSLKLISILEHSKQS